MAHDDSVWYFRLAIGFVLTTIVFLIARESKEHSVHQHFLEGYWDASQAFCERSGIESAQVYFRDGKAYVLIDEGERVILNKCVGVTMSACWWGGEGEGDSRWTIAFSEPVDPLPQQGELRLDLRRGMIGLFEAETLYLELFKNSKASAGVV
jgi:hypothetical protein